MLSRLICWLLGHVFELDVIEGDVYVNRNCARCNKLIVRKDV